MNKSTLRLWVALALVSALAYPAAAEVTEEQLARLGNDLTPLGGERAGNADGTIPEWTGGITTPPDGYVVGEHHRDPYGGDQPLFVINAANLDEHRDKLSVGHQRMLETYPSFEMQVYPTRRSASAPQRIYGRHPEYRCYRESGGRRQRRRRCGDRHPLPPSRPTAWKPSGTTCCATGARQSPAPSARPR